MRANPSRKDRASAPRYSFLIELQASTVHQISIETAQSCLHRSVLAKLPSKTIILGVLDLSTHEIEGGDVLAAHIRRALPFVGPERLIIAPDCGLSICLADVAFGKMQARAEERKG